MIVHCGISHDGKRVKFAEDIDTLSADIRHYSQYEFSDTAELLSKVTMFEQTGFRVCVDLAEHFYETGTATL